jgi:hypothetical protein
VGAPARGPRSASVSTDKKVNSDFGLPIAIYVGGLNRGVIYRLLPSQSVAELGKRDLDFAQSACPRDSGRPYNEGRAPIA